MSSESNVNVQSHNGGLTQLTISRDGNVAQPDTTQPAPAFEAIQAHDSGVTVLNAGGVAQRVSTISVSGAEIANHGPAGSILASARTQHGTTPRELDDKCIVTAGGMELSLGDAVRYGLVERKPGGGYVERQHFPGEAEDPNGGALAASAPTAAPEDPRALFDGETEGTLAVLTDGIDGSILGAVAAEFAMEFADTGDVRLNAEELASRMGTTPERAAEFATRYVYALAEQGSKHLESKYNIDGDEFIAWAREHRAEKFKAAVVQHANARSLAGYATLADEFLNSVPPSEEALRAGNIPTRMDGEKLMVQIKGQWMTAAAAARAGMI